MRKLIAVISTLVTALAVLAIGARGAGLGHPSPAPPTARCCAVAPRCPRPAGSTTRRSTTAAGSAAPAADTRLQLINSGNTVVFDQFWNTGGARSVTFDTHNYPNGTYTVRGIIKIRTQQRLRRPRLHDRHRDLEPHGHDRQHHGDLAHGAGVSAAEHHDPGLRDADRRQRRGALAVAPSRSASSGGGVGERRPPTPTASRPPTCRSTARRAPAHRDRVVRADDLLQGLELATRRSPSPRTPRRPRSRSRARWCSGSRPASAPRSRPANGTSTPGGTVQFTVNGSNFGAPVTVGGGGVATLAGIDTLPRRARTPSARSTPATRTSSPAAPPRSSRS